MPTRIIRDGILTSERINALSPLAELFYRRLMSVADDHGRYSGNLTQLRAYCYPLKLDSVKEDSIKKHLAECVSAGLIVPYTVEGKPYILLCDFGQRINGKSKFPEPPSDVPGNPPGIPGNPRLDVGEDVDVDEGVIPRKRGKQPKVPMPADFGISERVKAWAAEKGHTRLELHLESFKSKCAAHGYTYADWDAALMEAIRNDWAKLPPPAPSAVPRGKPAGPSESPLESALAYIRQRFAFGQVTEAERDQLIAEATAKHRRNA